MAQTNETIEILTARVQSCEASLVAAKTALHERIAQEREKAKEEAKVRSAAFKAAQSVLVKARKPKGDANPGV